MSFLERHWWIGLVGSLIAAAAMVIAPIVVLQQLLPLDIELGNSLTKDFLLAGAFATILFVSLLMLASFTVRGRYRARLRAEALRGNLAVMPVSTLTVDASKAPDVSVVPLVLSWKANAMSRFGQAPLSILKAVFPGFLLALFWILMIVALVKDPSAFYAHLQQLFAEQWYMLLGILLATVGYAALIVVLIRLLPTQFGKPFGVTASSEGIHYRTEFGREGFISWEEMKLLEVEPLGLPIMMASLREYKLYGANAGQVAIWRNHLPIGGEYVPDGMSQAEMTVRLQVLLHLINARTGLAPRTFSKALRPKEVQSAATQGHAHALNGGPNKSSPSNENAGIGVLFLGAGITLALAVVVILFPISALFVLNIAVASSLIILALILIVYTLWVFFQQRRASNSPILPPIARVTSFPDTPESTYALSFGRPSRHRLVMSLLGLLMTIDIVPALLIVPSVLNVFVHPLAARDSTARGPGGILLFAVAFYGILGIMLLIAAFWPVTWTVRATRSALSLTSSTKHSSALPWESIERITAKVRRGEVVTYTTIGDAGRTSILWFAEPSTLRTALPIDGTSPIAPDQLAALAAQRTGKDIEVVHA